MEVGGVALWFFWCSDADVVRIWGVAEGFYVLLRECSTVKKYGK